MTVDEIISDLQAVSRVLHLVGALPVPYAVYLEDAATFIDSLAANKALVTQVFTGVATMLQFIETLIAFLQGHGHAVAAKYLQSMEQ